MRPPFQIKQTAKDQTKTRGYKMTNKFYIFYDDSITAKNPLYLVEPELQEYSRLHAKFFLDRYHRGQGAHYTQNENKNAVLGIAGQKVFELLLQKLEIPYVPNDPIIDQRLTKDYDFKIPKLGTIEVKTLDYYCKVLLVKPSEWHENDYVIVIQATTEKADLFRIVGWIEGKKVTEAPTTKRGESLFNPFAEAKIINLHALNPPKTFMEKLENTYNLIW
jgi:hypothetical protein